ncbi:kinesin motor domain protein [Ichthyophthirius multifiliis]|uniref:Kinesin motor domain protein n=1 Tax=Ichthyophthirius multifiliis TaxID=5932 RepID=G0R0W8_ICHMU|nr:kinesin motor domain protein [Ichthyophthirius multifiliis]EGR28879.1 kinesin motor domain protein [Ichthyophthirius multifiliis]|eukprot:XP_004030115.1 kinesin motor domain protein [Ichthyophthirius multifiliis]
MNSDKRKSSTNQQENGNVKTYVRFRPNNQAEVDLNMNGLGYNAIEIINSQSVKIVNDTQVYMLDKIFPFESTQENIYQEIAVQVVNDVLIGYNGTIFAYGVSGSGKSFTMFGNIDDQKQQGIIPRMCDQLFDYVNNDETDAEYIIKCSMLEIYKENLHDSLNIIQDEKVELKIKENPQKGIFIQGLTQKLIQDENELIDVINFGYNNRQTRSTKLNEYSSRSHTIFMVQICQKFPNGAEKNGKLNLIDLAGCEKVSKSGVVGEGLEEAIKINLSLTCLGKVIHSLTTGQEHIPYRDSKLTRILQESLGGNYKTSLIVTCSMHSKFIDDTISSLKFATRAKTIKNHFKVNFTHSAESLKQTIELLKQELVQYKSIYQNFRKVVGDIRVDLDQIPSQAKCNKIENIKSELDALLEIQNKISLISSQVGNSQITPVNIQGSGLGSDLGLQDNGFFRMGGDLLQAKLKIKEDIINTQKQNITDLEEKYKQLEIEFLQSKQQSIIIQNQLSEALNEKNSLYTLHSKEVNKNSFNKFQLEILQKQIQKLIDQIYKLEQSNQQLLNEKKNLCDQKFDDLLKTKLNLSEIKLADYFNNNMKLNFSAINTDIQKVRNFSLDVIDDNVLVDDNDGNNSETYSLKQFEENNDKLIKSFEYNQNAENIKKLLEFPQKIEEAMSKEQISPEFFTYSKLKFTKDVKRFRMEVYCTYKKNIGYLIYRS